jgi:hypothetical protein
MVSEISRLRAMSSLDLKLAPWHLFGMAGCRAYKLEDVARSICSSSAEFEDVNQPAIVIGGGQRGDGDDGWRRFVVKAGVDVRLRGNSWRMTSGEQEISFLGA